MTISQRLIAFGGAITRSVESPGLPALNIITPGDLKIASYKTYKETKCEVTCNLEDPNCARTIEIKPCGAHSPGDRDFGAWQKCKNLCTDLEECRGFDLKLHERTKFELDDETYSCTLYYQYIHSCDYQVGEVCFIKECDPASSGAGGKNCTRLPNDDKWGMTYPYLLQQPEDCPEGNAYCKHEGESCDEERSFCREEEDLQCELDCRQNYICKRVVSVDPSALVTHAVLQCPFKPLVVTNGPVDAPKTSEDTTVVGKIDQKAIATGTYRITQPGLYEVTEDLTFEFQEAPFTSFRSQGMHAGKVNGIEIAANNVTLDLKNHTIKQSLAHFNKQRFFTHIVIGNQVFSENVGGFSSKHKAQSNIIIRNGILGRTSHFGIRGLKSDGVLIENIKFVKFEIAAVSFSRSSRISIRRSIADNSNFRTTVSSNFGVFFQLYRTMKWLSLPSSGFDSDPVGASPRFPEDLFTHPLVEQMALDKRNGTERVNPAIRSFVAKSSDFTQGNVYGLAIFKKCKHVIVEDCTIRNIRNDDGRVKAVRDLNKNKPAFNADNNALLYDWFFDNDGKRLDNKESITDEEKLKVILFKAQVWAMKTLGGRDMRGIDHKFVERVLDPSKPELPNVVPWVGNDLRGHVDRGAHAISFMGSEDVKVTNVSISGVHNGAERLPPSATWNSADKDGALSSEPSIWRGKSGSHRVNHAGDAYGIRVSRTKRASVSNVTIDNIRSDSMHVFGVAILGACEDVGVSDTTVDDASLQVASVANATNLTLPNLKAKALPFFRELRDQVNVGFSGITPQHVFVAPAGNCDRAPGEEGCPEDGNWERETCEGETKPIPVDCKAEVSACDEDTCLMTFTHSVSASNGGRPCSHDDGAQYTCCEEEVPLPVTPGPVNCVGRWSACDNECFTTYVVSTPSRNGGTLCPHNAGEQKACVNTAGCKDTQNPDPTRPVNCVFEIGGECDERCTKEVSIIRPSQNGGSPCPDFSNMNGRIRGDCTGSGQDGKCMPSTYRECNATWGPCDAATCMKRWEVTTEPSGAAPSCKYLHGALLPCDHADNCTAVPPKQDCIGAWGECNPLTCNAVYVIEQPAINGGMPCKYNAGELGGNGFDLDHLLVCEVSTKCPQPNVTRTDDCEWSECDALCQRTNIAKTDECQFEDGAIDPSDFCIGGRGECQAQHCVGQWGSCEADCMRSFTVSQAAAFGGNECSQADGTRAASDCEVGKDACETAPTRGVDIDCRGTFSECSSECKRTFVVSMFPQGNGAQCAFPAGYSDSEGCDLTQCVGTVNGTVSNTTDCVYEWSECDTSCKRTFTVISAPEKPFTDCPFPKGFQGERMCKPGQGECPCPDDDPDCTFRGVDRCFAWTVRSSCLEGSGCFWDAENRALPCQKDECVDLNSTACADSEKCYSDVKKENKCTPSNCHLRATQSACNASSTCLFNHTGETCVHNICNDLDRVTCDQNALCGWDAHKTLCRADKCGQHGKNATACLDAPFCRMGSPELRAFTSIDLIEFTASQAIFESTTLYREFRSHTQPDAQTCMPSHCDVATTAEACGLRADCFVEQEDPLVCSTKRCIALGFAGTASNCSAIDGCIYNGRFCRPKKDCGPLTPSACSAASADCIYDAQAEKCTPHKCSYPGMRRDSCEAESLCTYKEVQYDSSIQESSCVPQTCSSLATENCTQNPECYLDRSDNSRCLPNPCRGSASNSDECINALCAWKNDTSRCEPGSFSTAECDEMDWTECVVSKHCYASEGKCVANPCADVPLANCTAPRCFVNHAAGSVCKPAVACSEVIEFYGSTDMCANNPLCVLSEGECKNKPCEELSEDLCADSSICTSVGSKCVLDQCSHLGEDKCKTAPCVWDVHSSEGKSQCVHNPCHSLDEVACIGAGCRFAIGTCVLDRCSGHKDESACNKDPICEFGEKCTLKRCESIEGRAECLSHPECTHDASTQTCSVDNCAKRSADECNSDDKCVLNSSNQVCTSTSECSGLGMKDCRASAMCYYNSVERECKVNFCTFTSEESCETDSDNKCIFTTQDARGENFKCVPDTCTVLTKSQCEDAQDCFWGFENGFFTHNAQKKCYWDRCHSFSPFACAENSRYCQFRDEVCTPEKTCLGAGWSEETCGTGRKLTNPGVKGCLECDLDECCDVVDENGKVVEREVEGNGKGGARPPSSASGLSRPPRDGTRDVDEDEGGMTGATILLIIFIVIVVIIYCVIIIISICLRREKKEDENDTHAVE